MAEDTVRKILEKYFLRRSESPIQARERQQWRVESLEKWPHFVKSEGYHLYEIRLNIPADPPPRPDGVVVLRDGSMYHLNDDDEFRGFYRRCREMISPLELAGLLTRYQGRGPHLERHQNLIVEAADYSRVLTDSQIEKVADFTLYQSTRNEDILKLDFCTYFIAQEPPDFIFRVGLNRWDVKGDTQGRLEWSVRLIAQGLDSQRYSA